MSNPFAVAMSAPQRATSPSELRFSLFSLILSNPSTDQKAPLPMFFRRDSTFVGRLTAAREVARSQALKVGSSVMQPERMSAFLAIASFYRYHLKPRAKCTTLSAWLQSGQLGVSL
jgi:hypothetical protein